MKIALVNPITQSTQGYHTIGSKVPHLGLQVLARATPPGHQIDLFDEIFGPSGLEERIEAGQYDLVGVTAMTSGATRAYQIARHCREHKVPAVFGGIHASTREEEAREHFDAVAVGEADALWPDIVADAAAGQLKPRYEGQFADLEAGAGAARQDLQPQNGKYSVACIQTGRGCPIGCKFCSVTRFNGKKIRRRPIENILDEWNTIRKRFVFVVDDNFFGLGSAQMDYSKELLRAMIRHGKKHTWFSQTSVNLGDNEEALRLAHKAGCRGMLVGLETFNPQSLKGHGKKLNYDNVERYRELIDNFHRCGIAVFGGLIIGNDEDTPATVEDTLRQAIDIGVDIIQITNLTPLPGTPLFEELLAAGRLEATDFPADWEHYTFLNTVFTPKLMTSRELDESIYRMRKRVTREPWVWKRTWQVWRRTGSLSTALFAHSLNRAFKKVGQLLVPKGALRFEPLSPLPDPDASVSGR